MENAKWERAQHKFAYRCDHSCKTTAISSHTRFQHLKSKSSGTSLAVYIACYILLKFSLNIYKKNSRAYDVWVAIYPREWVRAREKMKKEKILDDHILVSCCLLTLNEQHCWAIVASENARSPRWINKNQTDNKQMSEPDKKERSKVITKTKKTNQKSHHNLRPRKRYAMRSRRQINNNYALGC